jgi:hypothetical protein
LNECPAVRLHQVQLSMADSVSGPFRKKWRQLSYHLRAYFIAADADGGANGDVQVCWLCPELLLHSTHSFCGDGGGRPPPTGMNCGDAVRFCVGNQQRNTIGTSNANTLVNLVRNQRIAFALVVRESVRAINVIRMILPKGDGGMGGEPIARVPGAKRVVEPLEIEKCFALQENRALVAALFGGVACDKRSG